MNLVRNTLVLVIGAGAMLLATTFDYFQRPEVIQNWFSINTPHEWMFLCMLVVFVCANVHIGKYNTQTREMNFRGAFLWMLIWMAFLGLGYVLFINIFSSLF